MAEQFGDAFAGPAATGSIGAAGPRRFGEVGSSMESIFGAPRVAGARDMPSYAMPVLVPTRRRRLLGGAALAAVAAVAGVAMGVTVLDKNAPAPAPPVRVEAHRQPPAVVTQAVPQANLAVAPPRTIEAAEPSASDTAVPTTTPRPRIETVERASLVVQPRKYRLADERGRSTACDGRRGSASFACLAEQLGGADRDLVEAYESAAQAGVQRGYLVGINRRWERARERAKDDPAETLRTYQDLTDELWTARRRTLRDDD